MLLAKLSKINLHNRERWQIWFKIHDNRPIWDWTDLYTAERRGRHGGSSTAIMQAGASTKSERKASQILKQRLWITMLSHYAPVQLWDQSEGLSLLDYRRVPEPTTAIKRSRNLEDGVLCGLCRSPQLCRKQFLNHILKKWTVAGSCHAVQADNNKAPCCNTGESHNESGAMNIRKTLSRRMQRMGGKPLTNKP
jgi:hypothetical protein